MKSPPSKQLDQFVVRLPDGMRDRIKLAADANQRSMNAEIVATLEEKYPTASSATVRAREMLREMSLLNEIMAEEDLPKRQFQAALRKHSKLSFDLLTLFKETSGLLENLAADAEKPKPG